MASVFASYTRRPMFDGPPQRQLYTNKLSKNYPIRGSPERQYNSPNANRVPSMRSISSTGLQSLRSYSNKELMEKA